MAAGVDDVPILRYGTVELAQHRPRVQCPRRHREFLIVRQIGGDLRGDRIAAPTRPADATLLESPSNRLGGGAGIGPDVQIGGAQSLPQSVRVGVDLYDLGIGVEVAALGREMPEPRAGADHQIALGKVFAGRSLENVPATSRAKGLPSNRPLANKVVANTVARVLPRPLRSPKSDRYLDRPTGEASECRRAPGR